MSQARLVVTAVLIEKRSKAEVARTYGISRTWVHELVRRYQTEGDAGLEPRSRRPRSNPNRTSHAVEDEIVTLRKDLVDQGLDAGAATIAAHLHRRHGSSPSVATIWRILVRRGFVTPQTPKIVADPVRSRPTQRTLAGRHHPLAARRRHHHRDPQLLDDHSRLAIASHAMPIYKAADVVDVFDDAFARHGLPASVLTDNGAVIHRELSRPRQSRARTPPARPGDPPAPTPAPTTRRPAGRSNGSTRPSNAGCPPATPPTPHDGPPTDGLLPLRPRRSARGSPRTRCRRRQFATRADRPAR